MGHSLIGAMTAVFGGIALNQSTRFFCFVIGAEIQRRQKE